ncbi:unnamed protein product [Gongylonema pulchrum]|uniref:HOOK domain-containing protein n=1 Tax=Gongylonema pulchrum TaxID=637853 RepID=A0A183EDY3_9BILA|nr:unnamed protein product [Gongylonema pulchrum]
MRDRFADSLVVFFVRPLFGGTRPHMVTEKNTNLNEMMQEAQQLKKKLAMKEQELQEALRKTERTQDTNSEKYNDKVLELKAERNNLLDENSQLRNQVARISKDLTNERAHVEELTAICNGTRRDMKVRLAAIFCH